MSQFAMPAAQPVLRSQTCGNCKFAVVIGKNRECRRNPPTVFLVSGPNNAPMPVSGWAPVREEQFCGEHRPRIEGAIT